MFWIDWRQDDDTIAESCGNLLQTGHLSGELVEVDSDDEFDVYLQFQDRRVKVPLSYSPADRHITLYALNQLLAPEYEVRFCIDSEGSDTQHPSKRMGWDSKLRSFLREKQGLYPKAKQKPKQFSTIPF